MSFHSYSLHIVLDLSCRLFYMKIISYFLMFFLRLHYKQVKLKGEVGLSNNVGMLV